MLNSRLLATKFHRPACPATWISRPYLSQKLQAGLNFNRQLTLVSAPAGFGKTTCVSAWLETLTWPASWLSLDAGDDDPGCFFAYFVAALQEIDPNLGWELEGALRAGQLPPAEIISAAIIHDMLEIEYEFLLVLDDFHVIQDRFILQFLEQIIANRPPMLYLVLVTREDPPLPLARIRAENGLTEIRARDLRFVTSDVKALFERLGLSLSSTDITVLENKTEGWVVGIQLAAIALQYSQSGEDGAGRSDFIAGLSGSHRYILSYLTEQVLDQQPDDVRRFLLQTSILDKLHGDLCSAVTGRKDGRLLLERLFRTNLFLIPLDDEGQWYRYHHLFADLLRDRQRALTDGGTAVLHQRASRWFAAENMVAEAVQHALAAEDYELAVEFLESHAMSLVMQGYAKTVNGWVQAIPSQWQSQSPKTYLALAWMHLLRGAYSEAMPYLERLRPALAGEPEHVLRKEETALRADWLVMQSLVLYSQHEFAECEVLAEQALASAAQGDGRTRSLAHYALASAYQMRAEYERAFEHYHWAIQYGREAENLVAEIMSTIGLARIAFERGQLHLAYETVLPIKQRDEKSAAPPPITAIIYGLLSEVCLQWDQIQQAREYIWRSLELSKLGGYNTSIIFGHVVLSRLAQLEGDLDLAAREIDTAAALLPAEVPLYARQEVAAQQVNLKLAHNRPAAAEMILHAHGFSFQEPFTLPEFPFEPGFTSSLAMVYNSGLRLLLHLSGKGADTDRLEAGLELANRLSIAAQKDQQVPVLLETILLRARIYAVLGNQQASQADYIHALQLAEPEGFIGVFIEQGLAVYKPLSQLVQTQEFGDVAADFVARLLAAFGRLQPADAGIKSSSLPEPLSERELDVLQLMADGLKYHEIADRLFISLNTVRYHVKAIYGKLGVNNRTQALSAARQQRLL